MSKIWKILWIVIIQPILGAILFLPGILLWIIVETVKDFQEELKHE